MDKYRVIGELHNSKCNIVKRYIMRDIDTLEPLVNLDLNVADKKMQDLNLMYFSIRTQFIDGEPCNIRCKVELDLPIIAPMPVDMFLSDKESLQKEKEK